MTLIDSHCHLDFPDFADLDATVGRAVAAGVSHMVTISTRVGNVARLREIAYARPEVFYTVGTHPHRAHEEPEATPEELVALAADPRCVAIGEAGLDYHYDKAPRDVAARVFRAHIAAARASGLPLVIHSRDADDDMATILREETARGAFRAVLHCFTSGRGLFEAGMELGLYVSFSGVLTFKGSDALREIARDAPLDRVLVETDAPYLAPVPFRGKRNEPAHVVETAKALAQVKGVAFDEVARATRANSLRFYDKMAEAGVKAGAA
ncbi:MAG: TatD family hydrolase [Hyphomicrobiales bacterium]|nr:TatD family hydrolase [Hyphomicrobiales bacterium]MDE2017994.1 TatD family hydrolase [Hyphomicrobiales bacterium]